MTIQLGLVVIASMLPGIFWLAYVESRAPQRSAWTRVLLTFLAGAISTEVLLFLHRVLQGSTGWNIGVVPNHPALSLLYFVVAVGLLEEIIKMLAMLVVVWPRRDFREPWDGLACASAAALGFASAENFAYVTRSGDPSLLLGRFLLSTLGHVVMSSFWGYALGLWRRKMAGPGVVLEGLLWAALLHGLYDWFLGLGSIWAALAVFAGMIVVFRHRLQESFYTSQRRSVPTQKVYECPDCHVLGRTEYRYCPACGCSRPQAPSIGCLACMATVTEESSQCPSCQRSFA